MSFALKSNSLILEHLDRALAARQTDYRGLRTSDWNTWLHAVCVVVRVASRSVSGVVTVVSDCFCCWCELSTSRWDELRTTSDAC